MGMFDDLADNGNAGRDTYAEIRKNAHVVNGGDAMFSCPGCNGTGKFVARSGRVVGDCFKCKGKGKVSKGVVAAAKGKQTREDNIRKFNAEHRAERAYVETKADGGFRLMQKFRQDWDEYRTLRPEAIERIREFMVRDAEHETARNEQRATEHAQRDAAAPVVDLTAIDKLFATAVDNQIKRPIFRTVDIDISKAPMTGRNAGALYVTARDDEGTYLGKLMNGKFFASREAPADTADKLMAIAADPTDAAIKYGRKTGRCGCCGRILVDPISILAVVGPICARKWGLDFMRNLAATEYANMKAEEIAKIKE